MREALEGTGIDIQRCPMGRVPEVLPSAHVAVPAMTKFDRAMLERAGTNLRAVIQFGVGVEGVDFACASERGIAVANIPSDAVPLNRRAPQAVRGPAALGPPLAVGQPGLRAGEEGRGGPGR